MRIFKGFFLGLMSCFFIAAAANYTITVDAAKKDGPWNKFYERGVALDHMGTVLTSAYGRNASNALKKAHDEAGFQYIRGHGILDDDIGIYIGPGNYNWTKFDKVYDSVVAAGMRPIVELSFMPSALATGNTAVTGVWYNGKPGISCAAKNWTDWENLIKALVKHVEERYGVDEVRKNWFFEVWNEPGWMYACGGGYWGSGSNAGYKTLYQHTSNAIKLQDSQVRLGGPAESGGGGSSAIPDFITFCKNNAQKIDFVSYHCYANDYSTYDNNGNPTFNKNNDATKIETYHKQVKDQCKAGGFTGLVLNTEYGASYTNSPSMLWRDGEMAASFVPKVVHILNSLDTTKYAPPYSLGWWALSDIYEENDMTKSSPAFTGCYGLLCRGVADIPQSWDVAKPSFNAYKLLHKLSTNKLTCTPIKNIKTPYVNAFATISDNKDTVSVLVYNQIDTTGGFSSSSADSALLTVTGISFADARVEHWVVDKDKSNGYQAWLSMQSPKNPTAAQWTTIANAAQLAHYDSVATTTITGGTFTKRFPQKYYSVGLIQITNAKATNTTQPEQVLSASSAKLKAMVLRKNLVITIPFSGEYVVQLFTTNGKRILTTQAHGGLINTIGLKNVSFGTYLVECVGNSQRFTKSIIIGQ